MEHQSSAEAQLDYYDPYLQNAGQNDGWSPIDATPGLGSPSPLGSPNLAQRSRVSFAPIIPPLRLGADTPSSVGLGIGSTEHGAQFPGYHHISRDSFQQDSRPATPPPPHGLPGLTTTPQEYALGSPYGAAYYYPQHYESSAPPRGPGSTRLARLTQSDPWKMLYGGWPMYSMFVLGFVFAVGHHIFYSYLDGKPADDQIRMMRFGGVLSYAAKASLVAAVIFAFRQQIWVTVIGNVLQLRTIDSLFAAVDEPVAMLNWEFLKKGKIAMCLAALAW